MIFFLISLPFVLGNGVYLFQLFDQFAGTLPLLFNGFAEVVCVAWIYGSKRSLNTTQFTKLLRKHTWFTPYSLPSPFLFSPLLFPHLRSSLSLFLLSSLPFSYRYLSEVTHTVHRYLATFWWIMWTFVDPAVMFVIFIGSVISQLITPLEYTAYGFVNVSFYPFFDARNCLTKRKSLVLECAASV